MMVFALCQAPITFAYPTFGPTVSIARDAKTAHAWYRGLEAQSGDRI